MIGHCPAVSGHWEHWAPTPYACTGDDNQCEDPVMLWGYYGDRIVLRHDAFEKPRPNRSPKRFPSIMDLSGQVSMLRRPTRFR
jgi:hypothetical protein